MNQWITTETFSYRSTVLLILGLEVWHPRVGANALDALFRRVLLFLVAYSTFQFSHFTVFFLYLLAAINP